MIFRLIVLTILNLFAWNSFGSQCLHYFGASLAIRSQNAYSQQWIESQLLSNGVLEHIQNRPQDPHPFFAEQASEILYLLKRPQTKQTTQDRARLRLPVDELVGDSSRKGAVTQVNFGSIRNTLLKNVIVAIESTLAANRVSYENYVRIAELARVFLTVDFNVEEGYRIPLFSDIRNSISRPVLSAFIRNPQLENYNSHAVREVLEKYKSGYIYIMNLAKQDDYAFLNVFEQKVLFLRVTDQNEKVHGTIRSPYENFEHDIDHARTIIDALSQLESRGLLPLSADSHVRLRARLAANSKTSYAAKMYYGLYHEDVYAYSDIIISLNHYIKDEISWFEFKSRAFNGIHSGQYYLYRQLEQQDLSFIKNQIERYKIRNDASVLFLMLNEVANEIKKSRPH